MKCGKGSKVMVLTNEDCIPCGIYIGSATPHEVNYIEDLLDSKFLPEHKVKKLIGDKAYDSDKHDKILLEEKGVELIVPHKKGRVNFMQDRRKLKGYKTRYFVENLNAHLQSYRRVVTRYEKNLENFLGFVHLTFWSIIFNKIYSVRR